MVKTKAKLLKPQGGGDCMECDHRLYLNDMVIVKHRTIYYDESGRRCICASTRWCHFECYVKVYKKLLVEGCEIEYVTK